MLASRPAKAVPDDQRGNDSSTPRTNESSSTRKLDDENEHRNPQGVLVAATLRLFLAAAASRLRLLKINILEEILARARTLPGQSHASGAGGSA
jgi:hypothetical protein